MKMSAFARRIRDGFAHTLTIDSRARTLQKGSASHSMLRWLAVAAGLALALPAQAALQGNTGEADVSADDNATRAVAIADLDGDTFPDLVVANEDGERNQIFWGNGSGGFEAGVDIDNLEETSDAVALGDIDQDGDLDIVIGNRSSAPNRVYENLGGRNFNRLGTNNISNSADAVRQTSAALLADLNGDGDVDAVFANRNAGNLVFMGTPGVGNSGFPTRDNLSDSGSVDSSSIAVGDLNNDGAVDLVIGNRENARNDYYINNGAVDGSVPFGARRDLSTDANYTDWVEIADLNNDGWNDVILGNREQPNQYLLNNQSGNNNDLFEDTRLISLESDYTRDIRAIDVDGDGDVDIVTANDSSGFNKVYLNQFIEQGIVAFSEGIAFSNDSNESISIAVCGPENTADPACDLDGDGDTDFVFGNNGSPNRIYTNNNEDPVFTSVPILGAAVGATYTYDIVVEDADQGQTITITAPTVPTWVSTFTDNGDGTAVLSGTPIAADAGQAVTLTASDGQTSVDQNFTVTVAAANLAPTFTSAPPADFAQNGDTITFATLTATDTEDAASALVFSAPIAPSWVSVVNNGDGSADLDGNPQQNDIGSYALVVRVTDTGGRVDEQSVTINVTDGNDRPRPENDNIQVDSGGTATALRDLHPEYGATSLLWNDRDPDPTDTLTVDLTFTPNPSSGVVSINADGTFTYTHDGSATTSDSFNYRVTDGSRLQQATVNVSIGQNAPPIANDDAYDVERGQAIEFTQDVRANDDDPDGNNGNLTINTTPVSLPANSAEFMLMANGTFLYRHDGSATTTDSFEYELIDEGGETDQATVSLNITPDVTPPVITVLGDAVVTVAAGDAYNDAGATAVDAVDGDVTANIMTTNPVNTSVPASYTVTYEVSDSSGNAAMATRTVNVVDMTPPVITLLGDNPVELETGDAYVEPGATATDNVDGDISANIVIDSSAVDTSQAGSYTVTYNVSDSSGNAATEVTRTVNVSDPPPDTTPPVITLLGDNPLELFVGQAYVEPGATATDDVDGDISGNIVIDASAVDTSQAGSYTVTYNVSDSSGNAATEVTRTVNVNADMEAPVITLLGDNPLNLIVGQAYAEPGATAADNQDGDITANIVIDATSVDTTQAGTYTVTYNVTDSAGNAAVEQTRTVNVTTTDQTPPVITIVGNAAVTVNVGDTYTDQGATATDNVDGDLTNAIVTDNPVNTSAAGTYQVTYTVSDTAGNTATATRTVTVAAAPAPPPPRRNGGGGSLSAAELLGALLFLAVTLSGRRRRLNRRSF